MPLPSGGCQTCRARHIKCDETRPTCLNCRKSGRHCAGWRSENGSLLFLSENKYASTSIRRPRGGARWVPEFSADDTGTLEEQGNGREPSPAAASDLLVRRPSESNILIKPIYDPYAQSSIPGSLHESLETLALQHFGRVYFRSQPSSADSIWSFTQQHFPASAELAQKSLLQLAYLALSLNHYGRAYGISAAVIKAQQTYSSTLHRLHKAIGNKKTALSDEMLIAIMVMAGYENNTAHFDQSKLHSYSFQHHMGAIVLLKIRQESRAGKRPAGLVDQCVRRQVIRGCVYRNTLVPDWLCDGTQFGEEEYQLGLDDAFIRLATLRYRVTTTLLSNHDPFLVKQDHLRTQVDMFINEAVDLLQYLTDWRASLDIQHHYFVLHGSISLPERDSATLFFQSEMHQFCDSENAAMWNRYQGTRMFVNCILIKLLFAWKHLIGDDPTKYQVLEEWTRADIELTANEMCASVPFAFGVDFNCDKDLQEIIRDSDPTKLYNLAWPFVIVSGAQVLNELQRQWIREKLTLVSRITGNATLEKIANMNLHYHSRLRQGESVEHKKIAYRQPLHACTPIQSVKA